MIFLERHSSNVLINGITQKYSVCESFRDVSLKLYLCSWRGRGATM